MIEADRVLSTPRTSSSGIIHLIPSKPDGNSITQWSVIYACCRAAAEACEQAGPLVESYLDLADRALRRLAVLVDRSEHVSSIERIMLGRAAERILAPIEASGIIVLDIAEERFLIALRDLLLRLNDDAEVR
jgi:hypothetical protein